MRKVLAGIARNVLLRRYPTAKYYHARQFRRRLAKARDEVMVYQMGKVGSSSIMASFNALNQGWFVHHIHNMIPESLERLEAFTRQSFTRPLVTDKQRSSLLRQLISAEYLRARLARSADGRKLKVVTLVRDPVARNLSGLFEVLDLELDYGLENQWQQKGPDETIREVREMFFTRFNDHDIPLIFFDTELKCSLGVDVYEVPFQKAQGYQIYRAEKAEVLLLRLEDLKQCAPQAFHDFLGISDFRIVSSNVGSDKKYASAYNGLLQAIRLPDAYLDRMYDSKYMRHFYAPEDIEAFRAKWRERPE